jgi:hypothetical protein
VIGLALDIDNGKMFLVCNNGSKVEKPIFNNVRCSSEGGDSIFPAVSCSGGCELEYICEDREGFKPPDGFEFVHPSPFQEMVMNSIYLLLPQMTVKLNQTTSPARNGELIMLHVQGEIERENKVYIDKYYALVKFRFFWFVLPVHLNHCCCICIFSAISPESRPSPDSVRIR